MKLILDNPLNLQICQRNKENKANIEIKGKIKSLFRSNEDYTLNFQISDKNKKTLIQWKNIKINEGKKFSECIIIKAGGWYYLEMNLMDLKKNRTKKYHSKFGIGDIFIMAGQSNSANHGDTKQKCEDNRICAFDGKKWTIANDPQKTATGVQGSPWPCFANYLIKKIDVPIGMISVGVGGSSVEEWLPEQGKNYIRLKNALDWVNKYKLGNITAILWHQGESDTLAKTPSDIYQKRIMKVIEQSRNDFGSKIRWFIALASYLPEADEVDMKKVINAQENLSNEKDIFLGPNTDKLQGLEYRYDYLHFNDKGLKFHGKLWAEKVFQKLYS